MQLHTHTHTHAASIKNIAKCQPLLSMGKPKAAGGESRVVEGLCVNVLWLHFNLCISNVLAAHFYFITFHIEWQAETARSSGRRKEKEIERARESESKPAKAACE